MSIILNEKSMFKIKYCICVLLLFYTVLFPVFSYASSGVMSFSITPPMIHMSIGPGEFWASSIKVLNPTDKPLTIYGTVTRFFQQGENGKSVFLPNDEYDKSSLSGWVKVPKEPIVIPPKSSAQLPFEVSIPEDAAPGGHYAAILIGTQPVISDEKGALMKISSYISSLLFVRIEGDVHENGIIRSFSAEDVLNQTATTTLNLRF